MATEPAPPAELMDTACDTTDKRAVRRQHPFATDRVRFLQTRQSPLRFLAAGALCLAALWFVDISEVRGHLARLSWQTIAGMLALQGVIIVLTALRFARIARGAGASVSTTDAIRLTFGSTLANMVLPTSLAGDAGRVWLIRRHGLATRSALGVGAFDRALGLVSLGLVVLGGTLVAPSLVHWGGAVSLLLLGLLVAAGLVVATRPALAGLIAVAVVYSLAAHMLSIVIAYLFLLDQRTDLGLAELAVLFPAVLFAASIPVSVGGWGTREIAAVAAFSIVGLDATIAIALAFAFGVTQTAAAAIGTAVFVSLVSSGPSRDD